MPLRLAFDIEANGLLDTVTKVHCIAAYDLDTGILSSFGPDNLEVALDYLYTADVLIAHNGLDYDFRALKKVFNWDPRPGTRKLDTLVMARLKHSDLKAEDKKRLTFPNNLRGRHSLEAWGLRLGCHKGSYEGGWEEWSQEMQDYMDQDVHVLVRLLRYLKPEEFLPGPLELEHRVAEICIAITAAGWPFDAKAAGVLYSKLVGKRDELEKALVDKYGRWQEVDKVLIPKRDNKTLGYLKGVPVTKYKTVVFNPGSRIHIEKKLREAGWVPEVFTGSGRAKLDEDILEKVDLPEAKLIIEYLLVQKRLGQLGDGAAGWLQVLGEDGRIHGSYNPIGTNTYRASHYSPNVAQTPANDALYGHECRELFCVPQGWKLVGADMSGLELRALANYVWHFDGGAYSKVVTEGDVHTFHQEAAGLPTRANAKTFIYAWLYGAGDEKIGKIVKGGKARGAQLKATFLKRLPAVGRLIAAVKAGCRKGFLKGIDGRPCPIRSDHSALNVLLQSCGAILCKRWLVDCRDAFDTAGLRYGWDGDYVIVGWIHDEIQVACRAELTETIGNLMVACARKAGDTFNFKVPLDSNFVVGNNWSQTH